MARLPRLSIANCPHLILQRTVGSQPAFLDESDRQSFLEILGAACSASHVALHAYSLRDHEVRLLATPSDASGVSRLMQALGRSYVARFNRRHGRRGTLWEGRFRATVLDQETALFDAMRWVEAQADEAGLLWSSAGHHLGVSHSSRTTEHPHFWRLGNTPFDREAAYRLLLEQPLPAARAMEVEDAVSKGWALGPAQFVEAMSQDASRRLLPKPRGRPRKK